MWLYSRATAEKENAAFVASSSLADIIYRFPGAEVHATTFAIRGFFEWRNVVIANTLCQRGDTILDVGSNIGTETLLFARIVGSDGRVVAFEPLPENCLILKDLIKLNALDNVLLHEGVVSDSPRPLRFTPPKEEWSTGGGQLLGDEGDDEEFIEVESWVLDDMFQAGRFASPRLLVMDVEGSELLVLRGAQEMLGQCSPYIILEINPGLLEKHSSSPSNVYAFLEGLRYKNWRVSRSSLTPASREESTLENWVCIPDGHSREGLRKARIVSRRLRRALFLPLVKHLNPAVIASRGR